jgi:hypothetical protein
MSSIHFSPFAVRALRNCTLIIAFALCANFPLRAEVNADGTETPDATSDPKAVVAQGKDGKSTAAATTTEEETEYKNWIELGIGGTITHGDRAQFEQEHHLPGDEVYGGISDMHYEHGVGEKATLTIDGHALWDINDYDIKVKLEEPKFGYIAAGFTEFRSWYDGNGGFFPPHGGTWFPPFFPEMHIDRGDVWVELGLRVPDLPEITIRFSHMFRDGQKDSTTWGDTTLTGLTVNSTRKIVPSFRDIDETRDILSFDASKTFGNTDALLGMRWEHIEDFDDLKMERNAGQINPPPVAGRQRFVTQKLNDDIDLFSGHAITETRWSDSLWFTSGYSYTTLENDVSGSRIFGTHFDSAFGEPVPTLGQRDHAFLDLAGIANVSYHVVNSNILWMPLPDLSIIGGFRYTHESQDNNDMFLAEEPVANTAPFTPTNPKGGFHFGPAQPVTGERISNYDRFAERLDLRYTGIKDWLFYAEAEWEEETGHVFENQQNVGQDEEVLEDKDTDFLGQKYVVGLTWYPMARLNLAAQYYHKIASYDNDLFEASGQRLVGQDWNTDDANIRVTITPKIPACLGTLSLVSRYDFIYTTIDGKWALDTEPLNEEQTGKITKHLIAETITWNPLARLYLQADGSVVLNQTETPASEINLIPNTSPTVVNFRNDYWTVSAIAGFLLDDKTDLNAGYSFFCANDHFKNTRVGLPYGLGATEHTVSAGIGHQFNKQIRVTLKYTYFNYDDSTFGGHNDYEGHSIFSGLQYRF